MTSFRERDLRQIVHDLLDQTGAFDGVYLSGLPERRGGALVSPDRSASSPTRPLCPTHGTIGRATRS